MARKRRRIALDEGSAQVGLEEKQDFEMGRAAQRGPVQQGTPPELARRQDVPLQAKTAEREVELVLEMPSAVVVHVAGTFNNWHTQHDPLRKGKDRLWRTRVRVPAGTSTGSLWTGSG
jgi:hypothetical protein